MGGPPLLCACGGYPPLALFWAFPP